MNKELKAVVASWGRSFLAAVVAQLIVLGDGVLDLNRDGVRALVAAGLAAVLPVILRWLNPNDVAFGNKGE
jgi:hypothetical protein